MPVAAASRSTGTPRRSAPSSANGRSGVGTAAVRTRSSALLSASGSSPGSQFKPRRPVSSDRIAFWSDSGKVRPMAIASPTDCIIVPSVGVAPGSFSNAQRGILVTT